jgi:hypothetical protein
MKAANAVVDRHPAPASRAASFACSALLALGCWGIEGCRDAGAMQKPAAEAQAQAARNPVPHRESAPRRADGAAILKGHARKISSFLADALKPPRDSIAIVSFRIDSDGSISLLSCAYKEHHPADDMHGEGWQRKGAPSDGVARILAGLRVIGHPCTSCAYEILFRADKDGSFALF